MPTVHVVILFSFPVGADYPRLDSMPTLYIRVYVHRRRWCWCRYGRMGIGMGHVYGMSPDLSVGVDIDDHLRRSIRRPPSILAAEALAGKSEEQRA
jgi:hypothetical protein